MSFQSKVFAKVFVSGADLNNEDDGQQILALNPHTLSRTYGGVDCVLCPVGDIGRVSFIGTSSQSCNCRFEDSLNL
ncbi:unnamed protein product [Rotaria sordida]|uniref:Uncharacterized protein n=1 Tax=Rotaria sordida TaxID=392033 RepID=A0A819GH38_9BILA|nr:unnamed protein product [Rotaria sordida]